MDSSQQRPDSARIDLRELADLVRRSPYGRALADPDRRRAAFYDALAASDDQRR